MITMGKTPPEHAFNSPPSAAVTFVDLVDSCHITDRVRGHFEGCLLSFPVRSVDSVNLGQQNEKTHDDIFFL